MLAILIIVCCGCMVCMLSSCTSAPQVYPAAQPVSKVVLAPGDQIEIKFAHSQEFNETQTIRPDGKIEMQFVGEVDAAGKTPAELRDELKQLFGQHLKYPQLAVFVRTWDDNKVYVGGEVKTPGIVAMPGRLTALEAIMAAGGFNLQTATKNVVVVRLHDGQTQGIALDLDATLKSGESAAAFFLQPRDIIYVPQKTVVSMNQWIAQYINNMIPNVGFTFNHAAGNTSVGYSTNK